jgi:adenylate cyclase
MGCDPEAWVGGQVDAAPAPGAAALTAAPDVLEGVARLSRELKHEGAAPIRIGIGLHAGEVVIGHFGSAERQEYAAIGDTATNIASPVGVLCKPIGCAIVCNQAALEAAAGEDANSLGGHPIKAHTPIKVHGRRHLA